MHINMFYQSFKAILQITYNPQLKSKISEVNQGMKGYFCDTMKTFIEFAKM
jgi:hypothetical protein